MIKQLTITTLPTGEMQISIAIQSEDKLQPLQACMYLIDAMKQISAEATKQVPQTTIIKQY
jgi:molybdopterin synthase catalytic subunit